MIELKIKKAYKNEYAIIYTSDILLLNNNYYLLVFIGRVEDGCIYDTVILPPDKYKQTKQVFTIYHGQDTPEVFYRVDICI